MATEAATSQRLPPIIYRHAGAGGGGAGAAARPNLALPSPNLILPCLDHPPYRPTARCSYEKGQVDARELADLLQQVACFAPGQSFHRAPPGQAASSSSAGSRMSSSSLQSSGSSSGGSSSAPGSRSGSGNRPSAAAAVDPARLQSALHHSLFCVAAYTDEANLPPHQHLGARRLLPPDAQAEYDAAQAVAAAGQAAPAAAAAAKRGRWAWPARRRGRRVLVGFARAVSDAALVATLHDVAVLPELQGLGLGRALLTR